MARISKEANREEIARILASEKKQLGDERFNELVDEITDVNYSFKEKRWALPPMRFGVLDDQSAEQTALKREEALKWMLIKQKYGI